MAKAAQQRRNQVLQRMGKMELITAQTVAANWCCTLTLNSNLPSDYKVLAPYFTTYISLEMPSTS